MLAPAPPHALLREKDRAARFEFDDGSEDREQRTEHHKPDNRARHVHRSLHSELPPLQARRRQLDQRLTPTPHGRGMNAGDAERAGDGEDLATRGERGLDNVLELSVRHVAAYHHHLRTRSREQQRKIPEVPECTGSARGVAIDEPNRAVLDTLCECRACDRAQEIGRAHV